MILYSLFVFFLVASATIANKIVLSAVPPFLFVGVRMGLSGLLLLLFCGKGFEKIKTFKKYFFTLHIIALFTTFIPSLLRAYAQIYLPSSRAAFWGTFEPFITALYMHILYGKRLTFYQALGCIVGFFAGAFFVVMNNISSLQLSSLWYLTLPDIAQICSVMVSRYGWIRAQELLQKHEFKPTNLNGLTFTISGVFATVVSLLTGEYKGTTLPATARFWGASFYTLIIGNMIAYSLYGKLIKNQSATFVSLAGLSVPLFIHLLAPFVFGEKITWVFFVSAALIFVALRLFHHTNKSRPSTSPPMQS